MNSVCVCVHLKDQIYIKSYFDVVHNLSSSMFLIHFFYNDLSPHIYR